MPERDKSKTRIVTHEEGDRRVIAVVRRDEESDQLSDEEIVAKLDEWRRSNRYLRPVD